MIYKNNIYTNLYKYVTAKNIQQKKSQYNIIYTILKNNGFSDEKISLALSSQGKSDNEISKLCTVSGFFEVSVIDTFIQAYKIETIMQKLIGVFECWTAFKANMMLVYFTKATRIQNKHAQTHKQSAFVVDFKKIDIYLKMQNSNNPKSIKHLGNCLGHSLPTGYVSSYTYKKFWSQILKDSYSDYNKKLFAKADQIEQYLSLRLSPKESLVNNAISQADSQGSPRDGIIEILRGMGAFQDEVLNPKEVIEKAFAIKKFGLENYKAFPELADIAIKYHKDFTIANNAFNAKHLKTAAEWKKNAKTHDNLPDAAVSTEDGKYHLQKLPIHDPTAYILGHITHCCQSVGGEGQQCVMDGVQRPNNGFYVLLEKRTKNADDLVKNHRINLNHYKIVGQGYAWLSKESNLVFDSWENLKPNLDGIISTLLDKFGKIAVEQQEKLKIYIGDGGKTPSNLKIGKPESSSEEMQEGQQYEDSTTQYLIYQKLSEYFNSKSIPVMPLIKKSDSMSFLTAKANMLKCVQAGVGTFQDLTSLDVDTIQILISENALKCYQAEAGTFQDLTSLDVDTIQILISENALKCYQAEAGTFQDLINLDVDTIQILISENALKCYQAEAGTFQDLINLDVDTIQILISENALKCYQAEAGTFQDLINLDVDTIQILISENALKCYQAEAGTFQDLINLDVDTIQILISENALKCYQAERGIFQDSKGGNIYDKMLHCRTAKFQDLKDLNVDKIHVLTSPCALRFYQIQADTFPYLKSLDVSKIEVAISEKAVQCYQAEAGTLQGLTSFDVESIQVLISENALQYYQNNKGKFDDLHSCIGAIDALSATMLIVEHSVNLMPECIIESSMDVKYLQYCTELILGCYATYKYHTHNFNNYYLPALRAITFSISDASINHFAATMHSKIREFSDNRIQEDEVAYISKVFVGVTTGQLSSSPKITTAISIMSSTKDYLMPQSTDDSVTKIAGALSALIVTHIAQPPTYYQYASAAIIGAYAGMFVTDVHNVCKYAFSSLTNNDNSNAFNTMNGCEEGDSECYNTVGEINNHQESEFL